MKIKIFNYRFCQKILYKSFKFSIFKRESGNRIRWVSIEGFVGFNCQRTRSKISILFI